MRVLLIDDHEIVWSGTQRLLGRLAEELGPDFLFTFDATTDVESALQRGPLDFDLLLLDLHLSSTGGVTGLAALEAVKCHFEGVPVCVISAETDPRSIRAVIEAKASGFVPKSYRLDEMEAALRVVLRHRVYLPAEFVLVEDSSRRPEPQEVPPEELANFAGNELSVRQREVLALAIQGLPNKLIARRLGIAEGTVKAHLSMVYRAMGVSNRTDALCRIFRGHATSAFGLR